MVRNLLLLMMLCLFSVSAFAQTALNGKVTDAETGEALPFANVVLYKDSNLVTGAQTDFDGFYNLSSLDPGTYNVEATYSGYSTSRIEGVVVFGGQANNLDFPLSSGVTLDVAIVTAYKVPLIKQDETSSGGTLTSDQLKKLPTRNIAAIAANVAGVSVGDEGDDVFMKGSRSNATFYMIDGIRVLGTLPPESEIDQIQVVTGGIEAQYGDVTGGLINITTKGPSSRYSGSVEAETSEFLDPYRNSLVGVSLGGPIIKKDGQSILGFRVSGRYTYRYDDDPPAIPVYKVNDAKLAELEANPVVNLGEGGKVVAAEELVGPDDVDVLDAKPFEDRNIANFTAKLDARLSDAIDVTVSGSFAEDVNRFTPSAGVGARLGGTADRFRLLNGHNNPYRTDTDYRGNFRFRHRLGSQSASAEGEPSTNPIQNFSYILQAGWEKNFLNIQDTRHEDRFFDYGYIGSWDYEWTPTLNTEFDQNLERLVTTHTDYTQSFNSYTPGATNPVLANYNNTSDLTDDTDIEVVNGEVSTLYNRMFDHHQNVGWVYDRFRKGENDTYTFNITGNFDFVPGGSSKSGRHNVQFGVMYEQRVQRRYDITPFDLWQTAQNLANRHIQGLDTSNVLRFDMVNGDSVAIYAPRNNEAAFEGSRFYKEVRKLTGQATDEYVNIDGLTPDQLSLDLFSAQELNDENTLQYWGYDYLGNKFDGQFEDFFTATDADGVRTFPNAPNRPIYTSAYIQDKFKYKDIILRIGVRVDRFDANTKVLKDPYSLYEIIGAGDFFNIEEVQELGTTKPSNIGDDFKVYVTADDGNEIKAFRDGEDWYRPNGTPVNNGNLIFDSGSLAFPKLKDVQARPNANYIKDDDFNLDASFQDYEVQVNVMPRMAFSFPISDEANFFAHYDILVQRPGAQNIVTPLDYYYFRENFENGPRGVPKNNANLLPEKTVDYEVGFQQKLTNTSALKVAAYYKEMRDMIQQRTYLFVGQNINRYDTYDNQDFGTVKGFTFQYDLRRTGNVSGLVGYTLQFADGTGSDPNSQSGLTARGNLRTLFPLSFDERHRVNASLDYRYASGKKYTGPTVGGMDIFANTGVNLQAVAVSGRPFTAKEVPAEFGGDGTVGSINGARLPWNFTLNLRIDKDVYIGKKGKGVNGNIYLRVSNLLDTRNIRNVYTATGSADNDGFLDSSRGNQTVTSLLNSNRVIENYFASYQWRMLNSGFYSQPRRIFVGMNFGF